MRNRAFLVGFLVICFSLLTLALAACGDDTPIPAAPDETATAAVSGTNIANGATNNTTTRPAPTATNTPRPTATSTPRPSPTATTTPRPTTAAANGGAAGTAPTPAALASGKYATEIESVRKDVLKKLDTMNNNLTDLRAQVINGEWDKAKENWKTAHLAFLSAEVVTPQLLIDDLYTNMDALLDERPTYGFQVLESILFSKTTKPTKDAALPIAARLARDGRQAQITVQGADLDALIIFRGLRNIAGGMAQFLGEEEDAPNALSQTSVLGTRAKLQSFKDAYAFFAPDVEKLDPDTNKKVLDQIKNVEQTIAGSSPDPHTADLAGKELKKAIDVAGDVLRVDPLLEGADLLTELGNARIALDGTLDALYRDNLDLVSQQFTEFEVGWEGKVGRSVKEVDSVDFNAIESLHKQVNEALYYNITPDKEKAKQLLVDLAKAVDKSIANVRKIPFTPKAATPDPGDN